MIAPFRPGDRALHRRDPREMWTVVSCDLYPEGDAYRMHCTLPTIPELSSIEEMAPADRYVMAPEGWTDPPAMPARFIRYGLSYAAEEAAQEAERADIDHQRAMFNWHVAMADWCRDILRLRDRERAAEERAWHLMQAEVFQQQIEALTALPVAAE